MSDHQGSALPRLVNGVFGCLPLARATADRKTDENPADDETKSGLRWGPTSTTSPISVHHHILHRAGDHILAPSPMQLRDTSVAG